ncbi:beta-lactamase [Glycocaulis alkaliphilus]|uniref:Beta-lactamase n=1 Tax=Glycocaulis alkaliphilus TaxID=1434191 RepID=A0A3T0E680_9PROT|nr:MBL fold metallo-hydrolase [Glycocaulis alkaliphilus]AZU02885.1 beta-lactamase [Glycocaulis alkaliphilus]GGB84550.1 cyclase [Glycocaulis alkaliphilus]
MLRTLTTIAASLALTAGACAQENSFETTDLGDGIYMIANDRAGNVGLIDAGDHLIMIDTQMPPFLDDLESAVREASGGRAPTLVINTHFHGDHVLGNAHFAALGAGILAHRNVAERLANPVLNQLTGSTPEALDEAFLPDIFVSQAMMLMQFGVTGEVLHFANAHTDGDIIVNIASANIIHMGDLLFSGLYPFIDLDAGGSVEGYIAALDEIIGFSDEETRFIAGHGPLSSRNDLIASRDMLIEGRARVAALVEEGHDLAAIQEQNPLSDFHDAWNWGFITTERMTWTFYRDITGLTE